MAGAVLGGSEGPPAGEGHVWTELGGNSPLLGTQREKIAQKGPGNRKRKCLW